MIVCSSLTRIKLAYFPMSSAYNVRFFVSPSSLWPLMSMRTMRSKSICEMRVMMPCDTYLRKNMTKFDGEGTAFTAWS